MRVTLIGAGNVGTHLARALFGAGHDIVQVCSRTYEKAESLAEEVAADAIAEFSLVDNEIDVCILAVKDDVIPLVYDQIKNILKDVLLVHTAGSVQIDVFRGHTQSGVIWPVQTLSSAHDIDFRTVPLAITGNTPESTYFIETLSRTISAHVYRIDDARRVYLHLAATFANNFSNHMYALAKEITDAHDIPFDILKPLIQETARKILDMSPADAQTGAAIRNDRNTIMKHVHLLEGRSDLESIYQMITRSIQKLSKGEE